MINLAYRWMQPGHFPPKSEHFFNLHKGLGRPSWLFAPPFSHSLFWKVLSLSLIVLIAEEVRKHDQINSQIKWVPTFLSNKLLVLYGTLIFISEILNSFLWKRNRIICFLAQASFSKSKRRIHLQRFIPEFSFSFEFEALLPTLV